MKKTILIISLVFILISCFGQSKDQKKYRKEAEEMRKQVWAWNDSKFKIKDIPQQYANASKVVIAHHAELTADSKSRIGFQGLSFGNKKEQRLTEIVREIVKLNDKNAVTEYSELSFTLFERSSGFFTDNEANTYIGIRVTKPNGSVKEIYADDVVLTKNESSEKKAKIAIPDLQPGDILDYFIAVDNEMNEFSLSKAYQITLFDDAPILNYSFHAELGKKYAVEYRSFNGAPELKVSKNSDKDIIMEVDKVNIPPFETALWIAPARQLPFIQINILLSNASAYQRKYWDLKKPGETYNIKDNIEALDGLATEYSQTFYSEYLSKVYQTQYGQIVDHAKKRAKNIGVDFNSVSNKEKAALLFYSFRFDFFFYPSINEVPGIIKTGEIDYGNKYTLPLFFTFKRAGLEPALMISDDRKGYRMSEIMYSNNFVPTTYLKGENAFFSLRSIYDLPFETSANIDGVKNTKSFTFNNPANSLIGSKKEGELTKIEDGPSTTARSSKDNSRIENLNISLGPDQEILSIKRSTTLKGHYKRDVQKNLILFEDYYESERKALGEKETIFEVMKKNKNAKKGIDDLKNAFAEARRKQKDAFTNDAKEWFEQDVTDMKDYKVDNLGVRHISPDFVYSSSFNLNGLVKKAGSNFIVEIGKIQGQPLLIKDEQRKRDMDVYMQFARSIEYNIEFTIPDGYSVDGVAALNVKVENETGFFIVEASNTDNLVTIKVIKHYLHNYEPGANFDKLLQFIDASNNWTSSKILFKKK